MSGSGALQRLTIEHLRGSVVPFTLDFERGRRLTIIYGENGCGKSTICDALDFLGNGKIGSLENRGLSRTKGFWPSIGKEPADVSVTLETSEGPCRTILASSGVVAQPPEARPRVFVLRRATLLELLQATPANRYEAIRRFVDVSPFERSEASLRQLRADLERGRDVAVARVAENADILRQMWELAGSPVPDPFGWARAESERDAAVLDAELQVLGAVQAEYLRIADGVATLASAAASLAAAEQTSSLARAEAEKCLRDLGEGAAELAEVLEAAQAYLAKQEGPQICPLCESPAGAAGLSARVEARLVALTALRLAQHQVRLADERARQAAESQASLHERLRLLAAAFNDTCEARRLPPGVPGPGSPVPIEYAEMEAWLATTSDLPEQWKHAEAERIENRKFGAALTAAFCTWQQNYDEQSKLAGLLPRVDAALTILAGERRRFTDEQLLAISQEAGRLYELVHPGEGLNRIALQLNPARRASLEIGASFGGQATAPQAYFSDSHLDTLGLCIYLALAALEQPERTIVALDDVLASVDEPHVERVIEMIYGEALKFQHCVITTHYRPWKEKFRWGWLKPAQCQFVELGKWSAVGGLALTQSVPEVERLRDLLAQGSPDLQAICSKAGVILEAVLEFLARCYQLRLPYRPGGPPHVLGEYLGAVDRKLKQALRVERRSGTGPNGEPAYDDIPLAPFLDEVIRIGQVRNVIGAHFREISFQLLDADALDFGKEVLALVDALTDGENGWPRSAKSGSYWATPGETRRLHPLKRPT